jgi:alpha-beta hydrolase superfamily lysophospholipase
MRNAGSWTVRLMLILMALVVALATLYLVGPRPVANTAITFDPASLPDDLDAWLTQSEAAYTDIRPDNQKQIVWANPAAKAKTRFALVYLHGFSASPGEVRPLPDRVATALGANLYFTRFAGHGRSNDAMAEPTVQDWANDLAEAIAIGERLGDQIILMSTSTGGSIATWGLADPSLSKNVAATIFISPNYGVQGTGASLLNGPWARELAELLIGKKRSFAPVNDLQKQYWTYEYPTSALIPMATFVRLAQETPVSTIKVPALFLYSSRDRVVVPQETIRIAGLWGGPKDITDQGDVQDAYDHVLAGNALGPDNTDALLDQILQWLHRHLPA